MTNWNTDGLETCDPNRWGSRAAATLIASRANRRAYCNSGNPLCLLGAASSKIAPLRIARLHLFFREVHLGFYCRFIIIIVLGYIFHFVFFFLDSNLSPCFMAWSNIWLSHLVDILDSLLTNKSQTSTSSRAQLLSSSYSSFILFTVTSFCLTEKGLKH